LPAKLPPSSQRSRPGSPTNVKEAVVTNAGHWVMEQQPGQTISLIRGFLGPPD